MYDYNPNVVRTLDTGHHAPGRHLCESTGLTKLFWDQHSGFNVLDLRTLAVF